MSRKSVLSILLIIIAVSICVVAGFAFYKQLALQPPLKTYCYSPDETYIAAPSGTDTAGLKKFEDCIHLDAKMFLEKDYELSKDLGKSFLTLLAGLLVGSITFSEKVINLQTASRVARALMIGCWVLLLGAIITCGVGMALMTIAAGWASYRPFYNFRVLEYPASELFIIAGLAFGGALACLLVAGTISMYEPKRIVNNNRFRHRRV